MQPDVFVVPLEGGRRPKRWVDIRGLLLAIEVLSPSTARADRTTKRRRYQRAGVPEYWVVDLDARLVERWRPADERPEVLNDRLVWLPDPSAAPFELDLPRFFAQALAEQ
jgi:Uma2 family endonuclease